MAEVETLHEALIDELKDLCQRGKAADQGAAETRDERDQP